MVGLKLLAVDFARNVAQQFQRAPLANAIQGAKSEFGEALVTADFIKSQLEEFVRAHGEELPEGSVPEYVWEGRGEGGESKRSYWLLGTQAHPDSAVVEPFTVAFEFDREPPAGKTSSYSGFKDCLMKASVHVLSGAYDAVVLVYALERSNTTPDTYLKPTGEFAHTGHLLTTLEASGMIVAVVPKGA